MSRVYALAFTFIGALAACTGDNVDVTYYRDIKPIFDRSCVSCHSAGNIAPMVLTDYDSVNAYRAVIKQQTQERLMPPWLPAQGCTDYRHDPSLSDAEIDLIAAWVDAGAPAGDEADAKTSVPLATPPLPRVDYTLSMTEPYTPVKQPDEYRCFLFEWPATEPVWLTGVEMLPGNLSIVHHAIAYHVQPEDRDEFLAMDAADPGAGYECVGGAGGQGFTGLNWLSVWAPGAQPHIMPEGSGIRVDPGSMITLQIHYNTLTSDPAPDDTGFAVMVESEVETEGHLLPFLNMTWALGAMRIPAGEKDVSHVQTADLTNHPFLAERGKALTIWDAMTHMHVLGTQTSIEIERTDGSRECLLDVPRYDFNWQQLYSFAEPVAFEPGDKLRLECRWDNSEDNQLFVDGERLEPRDVNWGEGTTDEMCLGILYVTE